MSEEQLQIVKNKLPTPILNAKKVLTFGDTHLDDIFNGQHYDYLQSTHEVMADMIKITEYEDPDVVILAGDLIGVSTGRSKVKTRQYLGQIIQFLSLLKGKKQRKLYVVKGNHDFNVESDYSFLSKIGVFIEPTDLDNVIHISPDEEPDNNMFIHLRNYNRENLPILDKDKDEEDFYNSKTNGINIVVAHNDFFVEGQEESYHDEKSFELIKHSPFYGADIIFTGHIHVPSLQPVNFINGIGESVSFLNLGCATRPSAQETYNKVWYTTLVYDAEEKTWDYNPTTMPLKDYRDEFVDSDNLIKSMKKLAENGDDKEDRERLEQVLSLLQEDRLLSDDTMGQIDMITSASEQERELAKSYILRAKQEI